MSYARRSRLSFLLFYLAILLASLELLNAQTAQSLAILDLEGRGVSAVEAASLTDRLRSELVRTGKITVVERGQMEQILTEQDFQLTGCTSDECAVEVGQLLGVTHMVAGSIGQVGSTFTIDLRTVDVQTGRIVHSIIRDYRGEIDGLLTEMALVAEELATAGAAQEPLAEQPQPAVQPPLQEPTEEQQQVSQPTVAPRKGGRTLLWVGLAAIAAGGGYYGYTQGWFGGLGVEPPGNGGHKTVGLPPGVPVP